MMNLFAELSIEDTRHERKSSVCILSNHWWRVMTPRARIGCSGSVTKWHSQCKSCPENSPPSNFLVGQHHSTWLRLFSLIRRCSRRWRVLDALHSKTQPRHGSSAVPDLWMECFDRKTTQTPESGLQHSNITLIRLIRLIFLFSTSGRNEHMTWQLAKLLASSLLRWSLLISSLCWSKEAPDRSTPAAHACWRTILYWCSRWVFSNRILPEVWNARSDHRRSIYSHGQSAWLYWSRQAFHDRGAHCYESFHQRNRRKPNCFLGWKSARSFV